MTTNKYCTDGDKIRFGKTFLEEILNWVESNFLPQEIFDFEYLELWAKENGYVKESE